MSVCAECEKPLEGQRRTVCSQACYRKRVVRMNREARQSRKPLPEARTCAVCDKVFQPRPSNPAAARQVTCSTRCGYEKQKARMRVTYRAMSSEDKARHLADLAAKRAEDPGRYRESRAKSVGRRRLFDAASLASGTMKGITDGA